MPGEECGRFDPGCHIVQGAVNAGQSAFERQVQELAKSAAEMLSEAMTWWVDSPTPPVEQPAVYALQAYAAPMTWLTLVAGILIAAIRMAISRKGEIVADIFGGVVRFLVVTGCGLTVITALVQAADAYTAWLLATSSQHFVVAVGDAVQTLQSPLETMLLALIVYLLGTLQWMMGFFRQAALIVLAGLLPLAAASGVTKTGKQTLPRIITATLVIIIYEPAVGWLIAAGQTFMIAGQGRATIIIGVVILGGSIFALPWLLRLLQPMGVTLAEAGGGSALGAAAASMLGGRMGGASGARGGSGSANPAVEQANMMTQSGPNNTGATTATGAQPKPAQTPGGHASGAQPGAQQAATAGGAKAGGAAGGGAGAGMAAGALAQGAQQGLQHGQGAIRQMSSPAQNEPPAGEQTPSPAQGQSPPPQPPRGAEK